ncbi:tRNA (adenosine(37)-N6)-dimethylallyltransferase MiaA [Aurantiacibacter gilvus]|uniref:tRNA dimethylallyltransferase n=1 Tax=Aurantiacibacter gilvus TaxID=3139141 RepID=A0ABU9IDY6_9SPHN
MSKSATPVLKPVALIAGPTASGKSDLAVRLALALREAGRESVVINADSAQVYADLQVLSARPSEEEMGGIRHRLFGTWDGAEACSAVDWAAAAKHEIAEAHAAGQVPILVGGTGLYIRTLLEGIAPVPEIDAEVREAVRAMPVEQAYAALQAEDPVRAAMLKPADSQRIARALEVIRSTGRTLGDWQQHKEGGIADSITLAPLVILPDRDWLNARCDKRFAQMMDNGAVEEVEALLARCLPDTLPVMRAIGVPQVAAILRGEWTRAEAVEAGQLATRQYAKRQYTWLRNQLPAEWPRREPENIQIRPQFDILFSN